MTSIKKNLISLSDELKSSGNNLNSNLNFPTLRRTLTDVMEDELYPFENEHRQHSTKSSLKGTPKGTPKSTPRGSPLCSTASLAHIPNGDIEPIQSQADSEMVHAHDFLCTDSEEDNNETTAHPTNNSLFATPIPELEESTSHTLNGMVDHHNNNILSYVSPFTKYSSFYDDYDYDYDEDYDILDEIYNVREFEPQLCETPDFGLERKLMPYTFISPTSQTFSPKDAHLNFNEDLMPQYDKQDLFNLQEKRGYSNSIFVWPNTITKFNNYQENINEPYDSPEPMDEDLSDDEDDEFDLLDDLSETSDSSMSLDDEEDADDDDLYTPSTTREGSANPPIIKPPTSYSHRRGGSLSSLSPPIVNGRNVRITKKQQNIIQSQPRWPKERFGTPSTSTSTSSPIVSEKKIPQISSNSIYGNSQHICQMINSSTKKVCLKQFSRPYDLIRHQETVHASKKKIYRCKLCEEENRANGSNAPKTFSRGDALSRHLRVKHNLSGDVAIKVLKDAKDNVEYIEMSK